MSTVICRWLFLLFFLTTWTTCNSKEIRVVCYYTNWSAYRPGTAKFVPQNINPYLCTHLIYAFGGFTKENTLKPFDKYADIEKGGYAKFTGLKTYNKNLKTMLAIGGWNEGSSRFSPMVANPERRRELIKNAIKFLRQNHFDGLDLDWEYPNFRDGGKPRDKDNYAQLVQELREEFDREAEKTGRPRLLLTMAVPAGIEYINKGYDVPKLTKYLDWMNILNYDYHSAYEPSVNHHSPLYSLEEPSEYNYDADLNIDYTIKHYLKMGAEPNKLVMGIPTYGRSYTLFNPDATEIGSPADGPGDMGEATRENGFLSYYEICERVKSEGWEVVQPNPDAMGPFAFKDKQWVAYDDDAIARKKAQYVAENNLGGIMFWSIDNDDFRGTCHGKAYPIIEAAKQALISAYGLTDDNIISSPTKPSKTKPKHRGSTTPKHAAEEPVTKSSRRRVRPKTKPTSAPEESARDRNKSRRKESSSRRTTTTEATIHSSLELVTPSYTTPAPPSTPDQGGGFKCEDEGFYPHPKDCKKYYWCLSGAGEQGIVAHQFTCPAGLYFNKAADSCDYTRNVLCNKKLTKATTTTTTTSTTTTAPSTTLRSKVNNVVKSSTLFRTTSTTTTPAYDEEYEEYDDEEEVHGKNSEEDPKVIKELLDLIKKAGGIEELEKQLKIQEDGTASLSSSVDATTPSAISKSLVERVLGKKAKDTSTRNSFSFLNRNSRGPQNEGLSRSEEKETKERSRPKYTNIARQRPQKNIDESEESDEKDEEESKTVQTGKRQPEYVNIRRGKGTTPRPTEEKVQVSRNKILGEDDDEEDEENEEDIEEDEAEENKKSTPQYVNIRRQRPTTEETTTSKYNVIRRGTTTEATTSSATSIESKYKTIRRGTTTKTTSNPIKEESETESSRKRGTSTISSANFRTRGTTVSLPLSSTAEAETEPSKLTTVQYIPVTEISNEAANDVTETDLSQPTTFASVTSDNLVTNKFSSASLSSTTASTPLSFNVDHDAVTITVKQPLLFEPRPFSLSSSAKPVTETSTRVTKTGRVTTPYLFRVGGRRKPSPALSTQFSSTTSAPKTSSRATTSKFQATRRKYPHTSTTSKPLESQEVPTKQPRLVDNRYRFVSRRPFIRKPTTTTTHKPINFEDQTRESSNQQSLEEDYEPNDTTELSDIAAALQELQQAPLPTTTTTIKSVTTPRKIQSIRTRPPISHTRTTTTHKPIRRPAQPFEKINANTYRPLAEYDYYDDAESIFGQIPEHSKVLLHSNGVIECLDQGNFPHPVSCKKFISCAKMENGNVLGWEYTCPKNLSFDPIGGICNWSAGLGCNEQ